MLGPETKKKSTDRLEILTQLKQNSYFYTEYRMPTDKELLLVTALIFESVYNYVCVVKREW